jgi:hypothetical protein
MSQQMGVDEVSMQRLLAAVESVAGSRARAKAWLNEPLTTFRGKSALELVAAGRINDVLTYLASIESGFVG